MKAGLMLKPNWKYWTIDLPYVEGKSILRDEPLPPSLINRAGWILTDEHGEPQKPTLGPMHSYQQRTSNG